MKTLKKAIVEDKVRRDTSLVPPLHELMAVGAMFMAVMAIFIR